jgi:hypothetical protein
MKKIILLLLLPIASLAQIQFGNGTGIATGAITTQNLNPLTGVPTAGSFVRFDLANQATVSINVAGTYTGALSIQLSQDNGTTGQTVTNALAVTNQVTNAQSATIASAAVGVFLVNVAAWESVRVSALAAVTGTANVRIKAVTNNFYHALFGPLPTGTNTIGTVNLGTAGTSATSLGKAEDNAHASGDVGVFELGVRRDALTTSASASGDYNEITTNRFGAQYVAGFRTAARTYSASANITLAASATDVFAFFGNGTSTVQVTKIRITGIQTTTGIVDFILVRRSTANTGGTSSNFSLALHETTDAANNSTPIAYTANPTPGTALGNVRRWYQAISATSAPEFSEFTLEFGENGKPLILSGTTQGICLNLNGVTVTGGVLNVSIEWIEF